MADVAIGTTCSQCGTLVACAGAKTDETLVGTCPVCKINVAVTRHQVVGGSFVAVKTPVEETAPEPVEPTVVEVHPDASHDGIRGITYASYADHAAAFEAGLQKYPPVVADYQQPPAATEPVTPTVSEPESATPITTIDSAPTENGTSGDA